MKNFEPAVLALFVYSKVAIPTYEVPKQKEIKQHLTFKITFIELFKVDKSIYK